MTTSRSSGLGGVSSTSPMVEAGVPVVPVRCQKVCKGPVVGVTVGGELHWLRRVAS